MERLQGQGDQGGSREAGKDQLDSLGGTREAGETAWEAPGRQERRIGQPARHQGGRTGPFGLPGKDQLDGLQGTREAEKDQRQERTSRKGQGGTRGTGKD